MRLFWTFLVVAFVVASAVADKGATTHYIVTGTVTELEAGERMLVVNEVARVPVTLTSSTILEGRAALTRGVKVRLWYRYIAGESSVADKVRVLSEATLF